jgi:hypothetical protein
MEKERSLMDNCPALNGEGHGLRPKSCCRGEKFFQTMNLIFQSVYIDDRESTRRI